MSVSSEIILEYINDCLKWIKEMRENKRITQTEYILHSNQLSLAKTSFYAMIDTALEKNKESEEQ